MGIVFFVSCLNPDCKNLSEMYKDEECYMIIKKKPSNTESTLILKGENPNTGESCTCTDQRWWSIYSDYMEIGDTLVKNKGELVFSIHKKDTVLSFPWQCEGKVYK
jgi:hypothetical protein